MAFSGFLCGPKLYLSVTVKFTHPDPLLPYKTEGSYFAQVFSCSVSPSFPPLWQGKSSYLGVCDVIQALSASLVQFAWNAVVGSPFIGVFSISTESQCRDIPDPLMAWKSQGSLRLLHPSLVGMALLGCSQKRARKDQDNTSHTATPAPLELLFPLPTTLPGAQGIVREGANVLSSWNDSGQGDWI